MPTGLTKPRRTLCNDSQVPLYSNDVIIEQSESSTIRQLRCNLTLTWGGLGEREPMCTATLEAGPVVGTPTASGMLHRLDEMLSPQLF